VLNAASEAARLLADARQRLEEAIEVARAAGHSWRAIGIVTGSPTSPSTDASALECDDRPSASWRMASEGAAMAGRRRFGRVRQLPSGRWQARYPDGSGRDVPAPVTFASKGEAARWLVLVEADVTRGQFVDPRSGRMTLAEWSAQWLDRPGKRANSIVRDHQALEVFLPDLGHRALSSITAVQVQNAIDSRSRAVSPATLARDVAALRALFNAAVDADLIVRSPARKVALPRVQPPGRAPVTADELTHLADVIDARYRALVLVGGVLGLRWGEAIGLRVCDVDFMRRTVTVAQTVEEVAGHLRILLGQAKTKASLRTLTAPPFLIDELARHLAEYRSSSTREDLVFVGPRGGVLRRRFAERIFHPAVSAAGLDPTLTFQALRHVAMTAMVDEGVHPRVMQGRAGHATSRLTMELYAHVSDHADRDAAVALEHRFRPVVPEMNGHVAGTEPA
jgi:integrase